MTDETLTCTDCNQLMFEILPGEWVHSLPCGSVRNPGGDVEGLKSCSVGFYPDDPVPLPPQPFEAFYPVVGTCEPGIVHDLVFRFHDSRPDIILTYEEVLSLKRVARAQIELEKRRGVNQR